MRNLLDFLVLIGVVIFDWQVSGALPVRPSISFAHFGFDEQLMGVIRKLEYTQPTPIQCQVLNPHCQTSMLPTFL